MARCVHPPGLPFVFNGLLLEAGPGASGPYPTSGLCLFGGRVVSAWEEAAWRFRCLPWLSFNTPMSTGGCCFLWVQAGWEGMFSTVLVWFWSSPFSCIISERLPESIFTYL